MAIATDTGGSGSPFAKFNRLGDKLVGAFASNPRESKRQRRNYESGKPEFKLGKDGAQVPALEEVMHFVAMPGTTAQTGTAESGFAPIEVGDHVRYSVFGWKWGQVIDQRKNLPAHAGFKAGQPCSGDVYTFELVGWSAETKNPTGAEAAGFTVLDGRILLRSEADREKYILHQARTNGGNTNPAKDIEITIRRPLPDEKAWEQAADELYLTKPWDKVPAGGQADDGGESDEPF
jgi:hypothetical protein